MLEAAASGILLPQNCGSGPHTSDLKVIWNVNMARHVLELIKATLYSPGHISLQLTVYINTEPGRSTGTLQEPLIITFPLYLQRKVKTTEADPFPQGWLSVPT